MLPNPFESATPKQEENESCLGEVNAPQNASSLKFNSGLSSFSAIERLNTVRSLAAMGREAAPAIQELINALWMEVDVAPRYPGLMAMALISDPLGLQSLLGYLSPEYDPQMPVEIGRALSRIDSEQAVTALVEALRIGSPAHRLVVLRCLEAMGESAAPSLPTLQKIVDTERAPVVRDLAARLIKEWQAS